MPSPDRLLARIRGEYREMPGLRLTFAQACRLWQVDHETCHTVLDMLIAEGFLTQTANGAFIALPTPVLGRAPKVKVQREPLSLADVVLPRSA